MDGATLVTILGVKAEPTRYILDGRGVEARLAPVAIAQARDDVETVVAFCTEEALAKVYPELTSALGEERVRAVLVPLVRSEDEIPAFLRTFEGEVAGRRVVLDLTQGPRHLALLALGAAAVLAPLGRTQIVAAYYGLLAPDRSPLFDLQPLLDLVHLAAAADALQRTGNASALAERLELVGQQTRMPGAKNAGMLARELLAFSSAYASGLPLELGRHARRLLDTANGRLRGLFRLASVPLLDRVVAAVEEVAEAVALPKASTRSGGAWKGAVTLTREELDRQGRIIERLLDQGASAPAAILLEEWAVSWACLRQGEQAWLDRDVRARTAERLHVLRTWEARPELRALLTEDQRRLGRWWRDLSEVRNSFAHAGMRAEEVTTRGPKQLLERVVTEWRWLRTLPDVSLGVPGEFAVLLVSPVGEVPGAFFTALRGSGPVDHCLCVCSETTVASAERALDAAGAPREGVRFEVLCDPFAGLDEVDGLVGRAIPLLARAREVRVNLTGGTTLMGLVVERLAAEASRLGRPVHRFVALDRRPRAVQEREPFVGGDVVPLGEG